MYKYISIWNGHLERILLSKHPTKLMSSITRPTNFAPYCAGRRQWQLKRGKIQEEGDKRTGWACSHQMGITSPICSNEKWMPLFCALHGRLKAVAFEDSYIITPIEGRSNSTGMATICFVFDAGCGFWQIEMNKSDKDETAFVTDIRIGRYTPVPVRLKNYTV